MRLNERVSAARRIRVTHRRMLARREPGKKGAAPVSSNMIQESAIQGTANGYSDTGGPYSNRNASLCEGATFQLFKNASKSALIVAASVVGIPCGKPLYVLRTPFFTRFADSGPASA
jgi:hypothetical protein